MPDNKRVTLADSAVYPDEGLRIDLFPRVQDTPANQARAASAMNRVVKISDGIYNQQNTLPKPEIYNPLTHPRQEFTQHKAEDTLTMPPELDALLHCENFKTAIISATIGFCGLCGILLGIASRQ